MSVLFAKDTDGTLNTGLVAYWPLNNLLESVGSNDLAQAGNNGNPAGNDATFHVGGKGIGYSRYVKTSATVFQSLRSPAPATTRKNDFSFHLWARMSSDAAVMDILHNGDAVISSNLENNGFILSKNDSGKLIITTAGVQTFFTSTPQIDTGEWVLIVVTVSAANLWTIYINNASAGNPVTNSGMRTPTANTEFGVASLWPAFYAQQLPYSGDIQCCAFWEKVLSAQEISDLWNNGKGQRFRSSTGLIKLFN